MPDSDKITTAKISAWLKRHEQWQHLLTPLRELLLVSGLKEEVKWGAPTYTLDGKNVVGLGAFKNHCALWFHQGVFLKDEKQKLVNAQEGTTKGLRQWRFSEGDKINRRLVQSYINEAIANQKDGKAIKPATPSKAAPAIPEDLKKAFTRNSKLKTAFSKLTPGKQREYIAHINDAKREATRLSRIEKCSPLILAGAGLHDKYR